jgi:molybdenum cofactor cytidylyltransferase
MIAALIIATGKTARRDKFEPLKEIGTISAIERIVKVFRRAGIQRIVVVSDGEDKTERLAPHMSVVYLPGQKEAEMLDNVKTGLTYLQDKCTAVMITHVAVPLFSVETVRALMEVEGGSVYIPLYRGRPGHPMLLRSEYFQAILSYLGDQGLAGAVKAAGLQRRFVEVADEGVLVNINDEENYEHLVTKHSLRKSHPELRVRIVREKPFYGPGAQQLLQLTIETGSLLKACRHMGISYSKGRKIISLMEEQLGYPVIDSQQGGKDGGSSVVTEECKNLMETYAEFYAEAKQCTYELFDKYFSS